MASVITDVQPRTIKAGDFITVTGFGFSPAFGVNRINVNLGVAAVILSESDTVIVAVVPAGIPTNQQVEVIASRTDTQEASSWFGASRARPSSATSTAPCPAKCQALARRRTSTLTCPTSARRETTSASQLTR